MESPDDATGMDELAGRLGVNVDLQARATVLDLRVDAVTGLQR